MGFPSLTDYRRTDDKNAPKQRDTGRDTRGEENTWELPPTTLTDYLKSRLHSASTLANSLPSSVPISRLDGTLLAEISTEILKAERAILLDGAPSEPATKPTGQPHHPPLIPPDFCSVSRPEYAFLRLEYPTFLPGSRSEWYSSRARNGMKSSTKYALDSEFDLSTEAAVRQNLNVAGPIVLPPERLFLVFSRVLPESSEPFVDNNNVQSGAITNGLCRALKRGDGHHSLAFVYTSHSPSEAHFQKPALTVILCSKADLSHWI